MDATLQFIRLPAPEDLILWEVIGEHLEEAEFLFEQRERGLDSPLYTLKELAEGPEARLLAHLDGLVIGGAPVAERLLIPAALQFDPESPARCTIAAMALLLGEGAEPVADGLAAARGEAAAPWREALRRAAELVPNAAFDEWAQRTLEESADPDLLASLLHVEAARGRRPTITEALLGRRDLPELLAAACRVLRHGGAEERLSALDALLDHPDPEVCDEAMIAGLHGGSHVAWDRCRALARGREGEAPHGLAMRLSAILGGPREHQVLLDHLGSEAHRHEAIRALGFAGGMAHVDALLPYLSSEDLRAAKLAFEAIRTITGLDPEDDRFLVEAPYDGEAPEPTFEEEEADALAALPPLEKDDLDADLVPDHEEDLPEPRPEAIVPWIEERRLRAPYDQRLLRGQGVTARLMVEEVSAGPMRTRHLYAIALGIRSGGAVRIESRALHRTQAPQLAAHAELRPEVFVRWYGRW